MSLSSSTKRSSAVLIFAMVLVAPLVAQLLPTASHRMPSVVAGEALAGCICLRNHTHACGAEALRSTMLLERGQRLVRSTQDCLNAMEIFFGIDADGVPWRLVYMKRNAVLQQAQLLEALDLFEVARGQRGEA